jgi:purine nucleosidase
MCARPLVLDCDPGVDDAIAILLTLASSTDLNLLGITTVAGNVPLFWTQTNARKVCELAGCSQVPVYAGCPRPLLRPLITAEAVHGQTGLEGIELLPPTMPLQDQHAVNFLIETLMQAEEKVTIAAVGPLTNLAIALIQAPQIADAIAELVIMGGAITYGNVTPAAEFNFYVDPHAAQIVLSAGLKPILFTLDLTHQVLTTPQRLEAIAAIGTPVSQAVTSWLSHYGVEDCDRYGLAGPPLHDPCTIAYLLRPDLFTEQEAWVAIETQSELTLGQSLVDLWAATPQATNARVVRTVDADALYHLLTERLSRL